MFTRIQRRLNIRSYRWFIFPFQVIVLSNCGDFAYYSFSITPILE